VGTIYNDADGITNEALFNAIKAKVHPIMGWFKQSISEKAASQAKDIGHIVNDDIKDLDFLRFFPSLKSLSVDSKRLNDISGIRHITDATSIFLTGNWEGGADISVLSNCRELEEFEIASYADYAEDTKKPCDMQIRGLNVLEGLRQLWSVDICHMGISDIGFVKRLTKIEDIGFEGNPISDITPLEGHPSLEMLDLNNCKLTDISALSTIRNLEFLDISGNQIKDFSPLKGLENLEDVYASDNGLTPEEIAHWENELQHIDTVDFEDDDD